MNKTISIIMFFILCISFLSCVKEEVIVANIAGKYECDCSSNCNEFNDENAVIEITAGTKDTLYVNIRDVNNMADVIITAVLIDCPDYPEDGFAGCFDIYSQSVPWGECSGVGELLKSKMINSSYYNCTFVLELNCNISDTTSNKDCTLNFMKQWVGL